MRAPDIVIRYNGSLDMSVLDRLRDNFRQDVARIILVNPDEVSMLFHKYCPWSFSIYDVSVLIDLYPSIDQLDSFEEWGRQIIESLYWLKERRLRVGMRLRLADGIFLEI